MKTIILLGKILLSFIILFLLYTIHFILDKFVLKDALFGNSLQIVEVLSSFVWSIIGGYITAKIVTESRLNGVIAVSIMTFIYMMLNYPNTSENLLFFWISTLVMSAGILFGGLIVLKKQSNNLGKTQD